MAVAAFVFGSSLDRARSRWCVWFFDAERGEVVPLAEYREKTKSDTAASELAGAVGSLGDAGVSDRILNGKGPEVAVLTEEMNVRFAELAREAIAERKVGQDPQEITVRASGNDTVHVVHA